MKASSPLLSWSFSVLSIVWVVRLSARHRFTSGRGGARAGAGARPAIAWPLLLQLDRDEQELEIALSSASRSARRVRQPVAIPEADFVLCPNCHTQLNLCMHRWSPPDLPLLPPQFLPHESPPAPPSGQARPELPGQPWG